MDKKLTDIEIPNVKELLEDKVKGHCQLCDFKNSDCCGVCMYTAIKQFIELFNCLEARIGIYETYNARKDEAIKHLEAENERLITECGNQSVLWSKHFESIYESAKETIKSEAYKEFAERLCEITRYHPEFSHYCIQEEKFDNLVKEMVGDNETVL